MLNHRIVLHAIDVTPARWRGDAGCSPLDGTSAATPSPCTDTLVDFHTGGEWAARNRRDQYKFNSKLVSEELRELRGYSVEPGSTCTRKEAQSRTRTSRTLQTNREQSQQDQLAELMRQTKAKARALAKGKK